MPNKTTLSKIGRNPQRLVKWFYISSHVKNNLPECRSGKLDTLGDHGVACHGREDAISRHDRISYHISSACSNLSPVIEKRNRIAAKTHDQETSICLHWNLANLLLYTKPWLPLWNRTLFLMRQRSLAMQLNLLKIDNMLSTKIAVLKTFCSSRWQSRFWILWLRPYCACRC